jgi:hypothetical protein
VDKDLLLKPRLPEADVEVPGIGVVRVRGLNRAEAMQVQAAKGTEATERVILALGMVDPPLTEAEAGRWQRNAPAGEIEPVSRRIAELSGLFDGADKEAYKSVRDGAGDGVRVLPGAEAGDDGGGAAGADAG